MDIFLSLISLHAMYHRQNSTEWRDIKERVHNNIV